MKAWIAQNQASLQFFAPDGLLAGVSLVLLILAVTPIVSRRFYFSLGSLALVAYIALTCERLQHHMPSTLFAGMIAGDNFALFFKLFFGLVSLITLVLVAKSNDLRELSAPESVAFVLVLTVGMSMMAAATDLLMIFLSLEMVSILSYIMVGIRKHNRPSAEAGLKYVLYGAMSSGVMIFGLSYLFGLAGSTDIREVAAYLGSLKGISYAPVVFFALLCTMVGFGFKIATFPTQMWCPDVYEGAATPVTAFLSVGPKAAGFAMTLRFFAEILNIRTSDVAHIVDFVNWSTVLAILAAVTMTIGNLAALPQRNLKRLMAYSSIGHAGYLLMGVTTFNSRGTEAILFYLVAYLLMNMAAFLIIVIVANRSGTEEIEGYRGLGWRSPFLSATFAIALFSLTGLPPFAGFIGKYLLFAAVVEQGLYWLAIVAVINSAISLFYYARILRAMYLESPLEEAPLTTTFFYKGVATVLAVPTIVLGIYWEPLANFVKQSAAGLF